eukprot:CAMPEP_0182909100 /NCGR_PEP_ID=MMETSP0034_2-20130328/35572_1 /TAXON_ID=156128 /ORGANISM="Nephroselmis pyriformis, Strain CCMP717" /LENGTH=113 /DNA_ID=CAMNT_0025045331 /DNA_START=123 /DNA_END=461 /DNA_ORIENTATION=+
MGPAGVWHRMAGVVGPSPGLEKKLCEGTTLSPNWQKNTEWPFGMSPEFTVSVTCVPPLDGPSLGSIEKLYLAMPPLDDSPPEFRPASLPPSAARRSARRSAAAARPLHQPPAA